MELTNILFCGILFYQQSNVSEKSHLLTKEVKNEEKDE